MMLFFMSGVIFWCALPHAEEDLSINLFPAVRHLKAFDSFFSLMTVMTEIFVNASLNWRISRLIMTRHVIVSSPFIS